MGSIEEGQVMLLSWVMQWSRHDPADDTRKGYKLCRQAKHNNFETGKKESEGEENGEGCERNREGILLQSAKPLVKFCNSINVFVQRGSNKDSDKNKQIKKIQMSGNLWVVV